MDESTNIGWACSGMQCSLGRAEKLAFRFIHHDLSTSDVSFGELDRASNRAANVLEGLGLVPGDVFFTFLPKVPDQFFAFLGALKARIQVGTLFSSFGEDALVDRLSDAGAQVVLTKRSLLRKVLASRARVPSLRLVLVIDGEEDLTNGVLSWPALMARASNEFNTAPTHPETRSVLHYTSGSTGKPKGVIHVHGSLASQQATARDVLGLGPDDIYWCTADQGWVTGTSYGIIGPWSLGVSQVHFGGPFDPVGWFQVLERQKVTVWYTAPTALRMLSREPEEIYRPFDLASLRTVFSVGEPLNPEVITWGRRVLGRDIHDTWFQTETGAIMIANRPGLAIRPGSMGTPVGGVHAAILDDAGKPVGPNERGNLCLQTPWPSMFRGYHNAADVYRRKFAGGYYATGDTASVDADGYYWFSGRSDDVINTAGHLVSPFEVESALLEVDEIVESAVVGCPDEVLFEKVVAFVKLKPGVEYSQALELKLRLHVSNRVSSIATPQDVLPVDTIPKNRAGKIMRRVLRAKYLGTDVGDTSTMESEQ